MFANLFFTILFKKIMPQKKAICSVYSSNIVNERTCRIWLNYFDLEDEQSSGRPQELITAEFQALLDQDSAQSTSELTILLNIDELLFLDF